MADKLIQDGYNADALHGDLSQAQRESVMQRFRNKHLQLLIATDVAARGLDVQDLTHVINYNLPDDPEIYIHRTGRTGRAGKYGTAITISHSREGKRIKELEHLSGKKFRHMQIPGGREICEKRLFSLIDRVENVEVDENQIKSFLPLIYRKLEWLDREELIKRFVSVEFNHFLEYYKDASDLNVSPDNKGDFKRPVKGKARYTKIHLNIGSKSGMNASSLIGLVNEALRRRDVDIGKIDIQRNFSFFEIDRDYAGRVISSFRGAEYEGTPVVINEANPHRSGKKTGGKGHFRDDKKRKKNPNLTVHGKGGRKNRP